jgi:hypothetical protein
MVECGDCGWLASGGDKVTDQQMCTQLARLEERLKTVFAGQESIRQDVARIAESLEQSRFTRYRLDEHLESVKSSRLEPRVREIERTLSHFGGRFAILALLFGAMLSLGSALLATWFAERVL